MTEWLKVMLEEVARKQAELASAHAEAARRAPAAAVAEAVMAPVGRTNAPSDVRPDARADEAGSCAPSEAALATHVPEGSAAAR
jgi:hypothetical protein